MGAAPDRGLRLAPFIILDNEGSALNFSSLDIWILTDQPVNLDDLLFRYFGTSEFSKASPAMQLAGLDRLRMDLGGETDRKRRSPSGHFFIC